MDDKVDLKHISMTLSEGKEGGMQPRGQACFFRHVDTRYYPALWCGPLLWNCSRLRT